MKNEEMEVEALEKTKKIKITNSRSKIVGETTTNVSNLNMKIFSLAARQTSVVCIMQEQCDMKNNLRLLIHKSD